MSGSAKGRKHRKLALFLLVILATLMSPMSSSAQPPTPPAPDEFEEAAAVKMLLPDREALNYLVDTGWDLASDVEETPDGISVTVVATPSEIAFLQQQGFVRLGTVYDRKAWEALKQERQKALAEPAITLQAVDTVKILRADYWQSEAGEYISVEAKSSAGSAASLTASFMPAPIFGITCSQAVGLGEVPENTTYAYSVRMYDPGTNSGSGHVTNRVWQGTIQGPAAFDTTVDWPITPSEGSTPQDSYYWWSISEPGGLEISKGEGSFDCAAPLPTVPPVQTFQLSAFVDAGEYLYHRRSTTVTGRPVKVVVTSSQGGGATASTTEWLPDQKTGKPYQFDFVEHYMDPTELYARIEALAAEFPNLAEIVDLPYLTNGYRRQAMGLINGSSTTSRVVITSQAWGYQGGNGIVVETVDPQAANQPLSVSVNGNTVTISLATDAGGSLTSTAAQVIAAINADPDASAIIRADPYRLSSATGLVSSQSITLDDYLNAPPEVSREPWRVRAIRIGLHRDGSKVGVLVYSQEHAREWVTPLIAVETAERLLRNYGNGGPAKDLLDNLDIFIIPSVNPDGANYSFYDYAFQRKNMVNYCLGGNRNDPNSRNTWGVDVNRNYDIGSLFDGYSGGSASCSGETFSGPAELSESESKNVVWVADTFSNIEFSMNIHSFGNYFMWSPGAYTFPGRITLPRPTLGQEDYFWYASQRILQAIKTFRGTVVTPGRTGPVADVLYSAAGNSGDRLWYANNIYAWDFEVGDQGFQPDWDEGHAEAMEFSDGLIAMFQVAKDFSKDNQIPISTLVDSQGSLVQNQKYDGEANVHFSNSEPATIYYTVDGSRPTFSSPVYSTDGVREPGSILTFSSDTTINWFAVDSAGNISQNYRPDDSNSQSYNTSELRFR
jgi:hypothetical protein